jgi:hypothetical protein
VGVGDTYLVRRVTGASEPQHGCEKIKLSDEADNMNSITRIANQRCLVTYQVVKG